MCRKISSASENSLFDLEELEKFLRTQTRKKGQIPQEFSFRSFFVTRESKNSISNFFLPRKTDDLSSYIFQILSSGLPINFTRSRDLVPSLPMTEMGEMKNNIENDDVNYLDEKSSSTWKHTLEIRNMMIKTPSEKRPTDWKINKNILRKQTNTHTTRTESATAIQEIKRTGWKKRVSLSMKYQIALVVCERSNKVGKSQVAWRCRIFSSQVAMKTLPERNAINYFSFLPARCSDEKWESVGDSNLSQRRGGRVSELKMKIISLLFLCSSSRLSRCFGY